MNNLFWSKEKDNLFILPLFSAVSASLVLVQKVFFYLTEAIYCVILNHQHILMPRINSRMPSTSNVCSIILKNKEKNNKIGTTSNKIRSFISFELRLGWNEIEIKIPHFSSFLMSFFEHVNTERSRVFWSSVLECAFGFYGEALQALKLPLQFSNRITIGST